VPGASVGLPLCFTLRAGRFLSLGADCGLTLRLPPSPAACKHYPHGRTGEKGIARVRLVTTRAYGIHPIAKGRSVALACCDAPLRIWGRSWVSVGEIDIRTLTTAPAQACGDRSGLATGVSHSQDYHMSCGRLKGIGPKVMKQAAAKIAIVFERRVQPGMRLTRTYSTVPR
jgi:hypothetical protein